MNAQIPTSIKRLYIGNLDESLNEYTIVQLFKPFGKITYIEVMVHHAGINKGKSRGFCFLEFETKEQSSNAIQALHGKLVRGKNLVVSFAHLTPEQDEMTRKRKIVHTPTQLSLLKGHRMKNASTDEKIRAIERKLAMLKQNPAPSSSSSTVKRYKPY